jgi:lipopolysaccharide/colanic/teichoic acid biosynthesis glycosyltransferase
MMTQKPTTATRRLNGLLTQEEFLYALHRERARADRTGREFSMIVFQPSVDASPNPRARVKLARAIIQRSRETDEIGWFDEQSIGALLFDCAVPAARQFAADVYRTIGEFPSADMCRIYTYPSIDLPASSRNIRANRRTDDDDSDSDDGDGGGGRRVLMPIPAGGDTVAAALASLSAPSPVETLMPFVFDGFESELKQPEPNIGLDVGQLQALLVRPLPLWKRSLDVVVASGALIIASPVMLAIAAGIKLTSPGPVLFKQLRTGLGGKPFRLFKFRTMVVDAEARKAALRKFSEQDGPAFKMTHDPRVTGIGRFLRTTSLDELPQLWNVLKGEMSLVGPRPLPCEEANACEQWHRRRVDITPGITCIWQVKGRSTVTFAEWVRMDLEYLQNRGLFSDLAILLQTIPAVLKRRGAR